MVEYSGIAGKVMLTGSSWHQHRPVDIVLLESLLQTYQSRSVTGCWRVDIQPVNAAQCTRAVQSDSIMLPEVQALLNEYVDMFEALSAQPPERGASHHIQLYNEGMPPPKLRQFSKS